MQIKNTIIIPTFNRTKELLLTIPQLIKYLDRECELIVIDQTNDGSLENYVNEFKKMLTGVNCRYYHSQTPSVPLAWNTAAKMAKGDLLIFIDDDIDLDFNLVSKHIGYYEHNQDIKGVAGSYYTDNVKWIPSSDKNTATTLAGVNMSFRKNNFLNTGGLSSMKKPFAPIDWELAESFYRREGRLLVGEDCCVFHRAPADGGCANQSTRGTQWYYGTYHNHILWMLIRPFPYSVKRLPRHFYWLYKYCIPPFVLLRTWEFWKKSVFASIRDAFKTYQLDGRTRKSVALSEGEITLLFETKCNYCR